MARRGTNLYFRGVAAFGHPDPVLSRDAQGRVSSITHGDGAVKTIVYRADGKVDYVQLASQGTTLRKTMNWAADGSLSGITETVV